MTRNYAGTVLIALALSILLSTAGPVQPVLGAAGVDLHWLWDDRCAGCHGHSGDFSRKFLSVSGEVLRGRHHTEDLRRFLRNHYLAGAEVDAVYGMLLAQAQIKPRFREECGKCHGSAAGFIRTTLDLRGGLLYGRESGRPIGSFLVRHRELDPADAAFFTDLLARVAREVYRP